MDEEPESVLLLLLGRDERLNLERYIMVDNILGVGVPGPFP